MPTGVHWLDDVVAKADFPQIVDTEGAAMIWGQLHGFLPSRETFRKWPVPYRLVGRTRRYLVEDVLKFARERLEQAPVRRSAAARRGPALAPTRTGHIPTTK